MKYGNGTSQKILETATDFLIEWENTSVTLDSGIDAIRQMPGLEHAAVTSLLFEYFRHKGFIDSLIARHARKGLVRQDMRLLIACAATQVFFQTGIALESAVNIAVDCGKELRGPGGGSFVNAMLRGFLRDKSFDPNNIPKSFPPTLLERWRKTYGQDEGAKLESLFASNPPITFRVRKDVEDFDPQSIGAVKIENADFTGNFDFYEATDNSRLFSSDLLKKGTIYIQDPATAMLFSLFGDKKISGRVLDCCAAPGGKSLMLWELCEKSRTFLTVSDRSKQRAAQLNVNLRRAGVRARTVTCDAVEPPFGPNSFDLVIADVPCTNTGVMRRRPDAPWRFNGHRLAEAVKLQEDILESISKLVAPGGMLLYSTCSIEPDEDSLQIKSFLDRHSEFSLENARLLLPSDFHDGAYAALMVKRA